MIGRTARMHSCASGHDWTRDAQPGQVFCRKCGTKAALPPPVPTGAPLVRRGADLPGFTVEDLGMLRMAGRWGLLRPQSGRIFFLCGEFSLPVGDLAELLRCAGGVPQVVKADVYAVLADADAVPPGTLVLGRDAGEDIEAAAFNSFLQVLSEEELMLELVPSFDSLVTGPGQAPF